MASDLVILDAGPLVAYFDRNERHHAWATATANALPAPFITSESVLSETCFLLEREGISLAPVFEMLIANSIKVAFDMQVEHKRIAALIDSYADQPMSLADATLVRLAELHENASIFTLDKHFRIYRKHGRRQIPLIFPEE